MKIRLFEGVINHPISHYARVITSSEFILLSEAVLHKL